MTLNRKPILTLAGLAAFGAIAITPASAQTVLSYFDFNELTANTTVDVTTLTPDQGTGSLATDFLTAASGNRGVTSFAGSTVNAEGATPAGQALALQASNAASGTPNNGRFLELRTSSTGFVDLTLSFATQRTGTGFNNNTLSFSTDGGATFTPFGAAYNPPTAFGLQSFDLSSVAALDNAADVRFRITFNGATASAGNNRIDNLKLTAAAPVPGPAAVVPFLMGGGAMAARLRRRKK